MSTPTKAAEIREALEDLKRDIDNTGGIWEFTADSIKSKITRALALLADMEREGEPAKVVTTIKGWVRPAGVDVHGPGYELGSGCGWCEFNEVGQPDHGDQPATLIIGTHPSPTAADAKDSAVDVQEVIRAGDKSIELWAEELRTDGYDTSELFATAIDSWVAATKPFRP